MATAATTGYGVTLQFGDTGSPVEYRAIAEVSRISGIGITRDTVEASNLTSPQGWKEFIFAMLMTTEFSCEVNYLAQDDSQQSTITDVTAGNYKTWRLLLPDYGASSATFTAAGTTFTKATHGLLTGQSMKFTTSDTMYSGITVGRVYWIKYATVNTFQVHTTPEDAFAGTNAVNAGAGAVGTQTYNLPTFWSFTAGCKSFTVNDVDPNDKLSGTITFSTTGPATPPA